MGGMTGQFIIAARRNGARAGAFALALALALALAGLLAGDATSIAGGERVAGAPASTVWREVKWPFPIDQWGTGRAFRCSAADCGIDITLYLRAKLGFCNCTTGVSDDTELDRV
ncbi:MAG TPA: hypothetical protein VH934_23715, partial [Xanthobacteraceae bacterium]